MAVAETVFVEVLPQFDGFAAAFNSEMSGIQSAVESTMSDVASVAENSLSSIPDVAGDSADGMSDAFDGASDDILASTEVIETAFEDAAHSSTSVFSRAMTEISFAAQAVGETIGAIANVATGALITLGTTTVNAGVDFNSFSQEVHMSLNALLGSSDAASDLVSEIIDLNQTAAFSRQAFLESTQTLVAYGIEADEVGGHLENLQDAAVATGGGEEAFGRLVDILAQVNVNGRIGGDELRRMADMGIDAVGELADHFSVSTDEIENMIETGTIGADELSEALGTRFAGAADDFGNTIAGAQGMISAGFRNIGSDLVEAFIGLEEGGAAVDGLNVIADALFHIQAEVIPALQPYIDQLAEWFVTAAEAISNVLQGLSGEGLGDLFSSLEGLGPVIAAVGAAFLASFAGSLPIIGSLLGGLNPVVVAIGVLAATSPEIRGALVDAFQMLWEAIEPLLPIVMELVQELVSGLAPVIASLVGIAAELLAILLPIVTDVFQVLLPIIPLFSELLLFVVEVFGSLLEAIMPLVEAALPILIELLTPILEIFTTLLELLMPVIEFFLEMAISLIEFLMPAFEVIVDLIGGVVMGIFSALANSVSTTSNILVTSVSWVRDQFSSIWGSITNRVETVVGTIQAAWNGFIGFITGIPGRISGALSGMWDFLVNGFRSAVNGLIDGWNSINIEIGPFDIPDWVPLVGGNTFHIADVWPNLPRLQRGGLTQEGGAAELHPNEAVLPLEDQRTINLLSSALGQALGTGNISGTTTSNGGDIIVKVYLDGKEFRTMMKTEIDDNNRRVRRDVRSGRGRN